MIELQNQIILLCGGLLIGIIGISLKSYIKSLYVNIIEGVLIIGGLIYIFIKLDGGDIPVGISLLIFGWATVTVDFARDKKHNHYKNEIISRTDLNKINLNKKLTRPLIDIIFTTILLSIAIVYFIFNPNPIITLILLFGLFQLLLGLVKRILTFVSLQIFYEEETKSLYVLSAFDVKRYPLEEATEIEFQTNVDVLKLFPLFTMFNSYTDFTTRMGQTVKLSYPGEKVYINVSEEVINQIKCVNCNNHEQVVSSKTIKEKEILPFYHRKNIKRLLGKGYFAITVKGVGAYATLLVILSLLKVQVWITILAIFLFWIFNLAISDRILKAALDVEEITDEAVLKIAGKVFQRANLPNVTLYQTDSAEYNGFAAGANIGRSMITLTSETLKLPLEAIEGILAHEAVHVKKRDVLLGQLLRFVYVGILIAVIFLMKDLLADETMILFIILWIIFMISPAIYSLFTQWMEVRADHLGATLLDGGNEQMAESLEELALRQDEAIIESDKFNLIDADELDSKRKFSSVERDKWYFRLLEFQFLSHPPMYWRIASLKSSPCGWNRKKLKKWWIDRFKESLPDKIIK